MTTNKQTIREVYRESILYNQMFLCCIIPLLLEKGEIQYTDTFDTLLSVLGREDIVEYIRSHPSYYEYRKRHVEYLKEMEEKYPDPNNPSPYAYLYQEEKATNQRGRTKAPSLKRY